MVKLSKHLELLGHRVKDKVTGFTGVVTSVGFDLYGCIQAVVTPAADKAGKTQESLWFDVGRLEVKSTEPVMPRPPFDFSPVNIADGRKGAAEKPLRRG